MKVWVTKYALTAGIKEVEAEETGHARMIRVPGRFMSFFYGEGRQWHRTPEEAVARANEMRIQKIASLEKQIRKLREMEF